MPVRLGLKRAATRWRGVIMRCNRIFQITEELAPIAGFARAGKSDPALPKGRIVMSACLVVWSRVQIWNKEEQMTGTQEFKVEKAIVLTREQAKNVAIYRRAKAEAKELGVELLIESQTLRKG